jgi:uncharacterized membrane protein YqgA involved in biofilm formation
MVGTLINVVAVLLGGAIGISLGDRLKESVQNTLLSGLGLFTMLLGMKNFLDSANVLIVLGALVTGGVVGEIIKIEEGLGGLGSWLKKVFIRDKRNVHQARFIEGFVVASLLFCVGPMSILGSIQDGLTGDFTTLFIKSILDMIAAMAFASTMGVGVLFSGLVILVYQGVISLFATQIQALVNAAMINEMNAVGGVLLAGIAISSLLALKKIRISSYLPSLIFAPLIVAVLQWLDIGFL